MALLPAPAFAGPPYVTDDPEPVPYRNWEIYLRDDESWSGTLPHVPDVQLHVITPLSYYAPDRGPFGYGPGDTELPPRRGSDRLRELLFVPVWLQKSFGAWTTYGGVGVWIDLGDRDRHWWYFGWQLQRRLAEWITVGAEVPHTIS